MKAHWKYGLMAMALAMPLAMTAAKEAKAVAVGVELVLLVDVSGSVSTTEYNLQRQGYIDAFNNASLVTAIQNSTGGSIAVTYIEWSGGSQQSQQVSWTLVNDATSAAAFATAIGGTSRAFAGQTATGSAINFATPLFTGNGFEGQRLVMDVSGDGSENDGADTSDARDAALLAGVNVINGIVIGGDPSVETFYQNNIQAGPNSFVIAVDDFNDFGNAILSKLTREITNVPEPSTLLTFAAGALGAGWLSRRRRKV